ncbi:hypothetical protein AAMO2058_000294500 [Amorphochlora amoebiformis]
MASIKIGGVPEHFNYIFTLAEERGLYKKYGVKVEFVIQKCGTGAMIAALKKKEQDIVVALTEGLVADIATGGSLVLLGTYVSSPLCWAISTGAKNEKIQSVDDLKGATIAISRYGSGSHLMATVMAAQMGWEAKDLKFKVIGNFKKLRDSVNSGEADAFMWETFTTKPYHDSKEIKRIGEIYTPWPCFMLAARADVAKEKREAISKVLAAIEEAAAIFHSEEEKMIGIISKKYSLQPQDAKAWYSTVKINPKSTVSLRALQLAVDSLSDAGVLTEENVVIEPLKFYLSARESGVTSSPPTLCQFAFKDIANVNASTEDIKSGYVIAYWKIRGLSAPLRMMCSYAGAEWSDVGYRAFMNKDGTVNKVSWFVDAKPKIIKKNPILNLPYVIDTKSGEVITQSVACLLFLAQRLNLDGPDKTALGMARMSQLVCQAQDLRNAGVRCFYGMDDHKSYIERSMPSHYNKFQNWLSLHKTKFLLGPSPTAPDFHLWEMLDHNEMLAIELKSKSYLDAYPRLKQYYTDFKGLEKLKGYFESPAFLYDCNNPHAKYPLPATLRN